MRLGQWENNLTDAHRLPTTPELAMLPTGRFEANKKDRGRLV